MSYFALDIFSSLSSLHLYIFFSENTCFLLGHIAGKYVDSLNHEDKSLKPGILDLFLHLLFLQPTLHLGLMLLFCLLSLSYPDILAETGEGEAGDICFTPVSEATRSSPALSRFPVPYIVKNKTGMASVSYTLQDRFLRNHI